MRVQLALNVSNLDDAISFYSKLFGVSPHKVRDGYANFAVEFPPLKLVLFENPNAPERLNHLGVEVFGPEEFAAAKERLSDANILDEVQFNETCCHATQDKLWSREPQGLRWEWYQITDDAPAMTTKQSSCCSGPGVINSEAARTCLNPDDC